LLEPSLSVPSLSAPSRSDLIAVMVNSYWAQDACADAPRDGDCRMRVGRLFGEVKAGISRVFSARLFAPAFHRC
jgi:hypothetical protein